MADLKPDDEAAVDRLAFFVLKEAYAALASVMMSMDAHVADALFSAVDRRVTDMLQRMVSERSEGAESASVALAVGTKLAEALEHAHGREPFSAAEIPKSPLQTARGTAPPDSPGRADAMRAIAALKLSIPKRH